MSRLWDMWLMDLREPPEESHGEPRHEQRTSRVQTKRSVIHKPRTRRSLNAKIQRFSGADSPRNPLETRRKSRNYWKSTTPEKPTRSSQHRSSLQISGPGMLVRPGSRQQSLKGLG